MYVKVSVLYSVYSEKMAKKGELYFHKGRIHPLLVIVGYVFVQMIPSNEIQQRSHLEIFAQVGLYLFTEVCHLFTSPYLE